MPDAAPWKRRRIVAEPDTTPRYSLDDDSDAPLYIPVKRRRELEIARLANKLASAVEVG